MSVETPRINSTAGTTDQPLRVGTRLDRLQTTIDSALPLGLAPAVLLLLAVLSGIAVAGYSIYDRFGGGRPADLTLWTTAKEHAKTYEAALPNWNKAHPDATLAIKLVSGEAVNNRLRAAFWSNSAVPDLVEVEISSAGSFFRGPVDSVGFIDLKPWLEETGLIHGIVKTRLAPYTNRGRIFGLPHDVHPVGLAYNAQAFAELGIDPDELTTWEKFAEVGRRITRRGGDDPRYMISLSINGPGDFEVLMFQNGGGYFDADGNVIFDSPETLEVLLWYIPQVAGPERIAVEAGGGPSLAQNLGKARVLSMLAPDWRSRIISEDVPEMSGKMRLMPLPAFKPGGRRTSTRGGTMIGITRACEMPDAAKDAIRFLYGDKTELAQRFRSSNILPPFKELWTDPVFDEPREYYGGQRIGTFYISLAEEVPPQYGSPFIQLAKAKVGGVIAACVDQYNPDDPEAFAAFAEARLHLAADQVREQITRNPF